MTESPAPFWTMGRMACGTCRGYINMRNTRRRRAAARFLDAMTYLRHARYRLLHGPDWPHWASQRYLSGRVVRSPLYSRLVYWACSTRLMGPLPSHPNCLPGEEDP